MKTNLEILGIVLQTWAAKMGILTVDIPESGKVAIILPLWFYVKSILADFAKLKADVLTILKTLNFDF